MNFYKIIIFIAIIVLIIFLSIVAISIYNSKKDAIFPPHISICPDYYIYNEETQKCTTKKFNFENQDDYNLCKEIDFFNTDNDLILEFVRLVVVNQQIKMMILQIIKHLVWDQIVEYVKKRYRQQIVELIGME